MLYAAQIAQGDQYTLTPGILTTSIDDSTIVGGSSWADLKATAMLEDYSSSAEYQALSSDGQDLVNELIAAQTA